MHQSLTIHALELPKAQSRSARPPLNRFARLSFEHALRLYREQLPLREVRDVALQIATWFVGSFVRFLSAESPGLMAIADLGEFKFSAIESFRGILHRTVKASLRSDPQPIPHWAAARVVEVWNVPTL